MATTLKQPLFWRTINWLLFKPLYKGHFLLSPRWQLWRGSTVTYCIKQNTANEQLYHQESSEKKFPLVNCYIFLSNFPTFVSYKNDKFDTGLSHLCIQCTFPGPLRHTALFQDFLKSTMYLSMPIMCRWHFQNKHLRFNSICGMTFHFNDKYYNIMDNYAICCLCLTKLHDCIHQRSKQTYK